MFKLFRVICYLFIAFCASISVIGFKGAMESGDLGEAVRAFLLLAQVVLIGLVMRRIGEKSEAGMVEPEQKPTRINPALANLRIVPGLVIGFVAAIPFTFLFGADTHTVARIRLWFVAYGASLYLGRLLYRHWMKIEEGVPTGNNPIIDKTIVYSVIVFGGFMMCFATRGLFGA